MVFLELKRRGKEIYYWSGKSEVDFVIKEGPHVNELIQVCWNIDNDKKNAELKGLIEAMNEFNLKMGLVITEDSDIEEMIDGKKIKYMPLWKWLLDIESLFTVTVIN